MLKYLLTIIVLGLALVEIEAQPPRNFKDPAPVQSDEYLAELNKYHRYDEDRPRLYAMPGDGERNNGRQNIEDNTERVWHRKSRKTEGNKPPAVPLSNVEREKIIRNHVSDLTLNMDNRMKNRFEERFEKKWGNNFD